jgi:NAD(P)-dependent dehydrogenase (short-subunit alcohol dehydrogenase family)
MKIDIDFTGRHVFVFGGTTGINFGIAKAFAKHVKRSVLT